jgi:hypothetical protein
MKTSKLILIAALISAPALADPASQGQTQQQAANTAQSAQALPQQPAPSRSLSEFLGRTINTARMQAEDEVQFETRRQVNKAFNRLIGR